MRGEFTNLKETLATNLATKRGLPEILKTIQHYIQNLPHVGTELPKSWVKVREALEQDDRSFISLGDYLKICEENGFTRREDALQLSQYLHDLGVCLHFQDDDLLMRTVILKPTWGTDAVYKVLDNAQVIDNMGKFDRKELATIWHEEKYANMRPELLGLMMKFKLCYEIPRHPGVYIAPQLLSLNQPEHNQEQIQCQNSFQMVNVRGLTDDINLSQLSTEISGNSTTINIYGPAYGVAGNIQQDQKINPPQSDRPDRDSPP